MKEVDLVKVMGIILDNAIEEVCELNSGYIQVAFIKNGKSVSIIVKNTCRESLEPIYKLKEEGFSSKGISRGLGLFSLENILNKYDNISHNILVENNEFIHKLEIED